MNNFSGKTVLITGGSSGIGKQLAFDCARLGAQVIIVSHDAERLRATEAELRTVSPTAFAVPCDVASHDEVARMADTVLARCQGLDVLINNAGYAIYQTFADTDLGEIYRLTEVNLLGTIRCIKVFLSSMIAQRQGVIINMASIAGRVPLTPNSVYCASKHGMVALSQTLRYELACFNVTVQVICPGRVETSFFDHETFRTRAPRVETKYTVSVEAVAQATLRAIRTGRFMTYVPRTLGLMTWVLNAFPWLLKPGFARLMQARIRSYYAVENVRSGGARDE